MSKNEHSRYITQQDDNDEYQSNRNPKKQKAPRFIKNGLQDVDPDQIVINLSKTHYDVIQLVVDELGWIAEQSKKSQKWDIMWTDNHIDAEDLFKLNDHQKISHFPAIYVLAKKNFLGRSLMKMSRIFPKQYNFFPPTWSVPSQIAQLMRFDSQHAEDEKTIYIFKPQAASQGKGIALFSSIQQLQGKTGIVQIYLNNPYLIDGLKFDMRIYVLIYGCDPIRIYVYEEGLARFATQSYQKAKKKNLKENYVHLTNYAINKNNKKFVFNTSEKHMNVGHKRSLTSIFNLLKARGVDISIIKSKIDKLIVKTLLVGKPMLNHMYGLSQMDNLANDHCFQILGFDPILLEVNHTPSFATDTPLDKSIKKNLIKETLLLLNVNVKTKKEKIQKKKQYDEKRNMRKLTKLTPEEKYQLKKAIEKQKDAHQASTLKRYRRLYPTDTNQFQQIQEVSRKIFNEQCGFKNKQSKQAKQAKQGRFISSPAKKNLQSQRPQSFQQIETAKINKIKTRLQMSSVASQNSVLFEENQEKLPDISPKKVCSFRGSTISPARLMKTYEFNPQKVFSQFQSKINTNKIYIQRRIQDVQLANHPQNRQEKESTHQTKRQGCFVQPKILKLNEIIYKSISKTSDQTTGLQTKLQANDRLAHKNFADFVSYTNRQKLYNDLNDISTITGLKRRESNKKKDQYSCILSKGFVYDNKKLQQLSNQQLLIMKKITMNKSNNLVFRYFNRNN